MHDPPSVSSLIEEMSGFAEAVGNALSVPGIDWHWRPHAEEWSLTEVACHLRDVDKEVHQVRFRQLITSENVFLTGENSDVWVQQRQYRLQDGPKALGDFLSARQQTVALLSEIDDEAIWERSGRHAYFGTTSMHELLNLAVRHDRAHWEQICALLEEHP